MARVQYDDDTLTPEALEAARSRVESITNIEQPQQPTETLTAPHGHPNPPAAIKGTKTRGEGKTITLADAELVEHIKKMAKEDYDMPPAQWLTRKLRKLQAAGSLANE